MGYGDYATAVRKRRRRRMDGRTVRGVTKALDAALADEQRDTEIRAMFEKGMLYRQIGDALGGITRQRATQLVERAIMRKMMLLEYRAGKDVESIAKDWAAIYPRKERKRRGKVKEAQDASAHQGAAGSE